MSLLSVKNFVAPFTNSTHLVTIVLVTVLFALFRLQGGSVLISRDNDRQSESSNTRQFRQPAPIKNEQDTSESLDDLNSEINSFSKSSSANLEPEDIPDKGTISISPEEEDLLGEMIGSKPLPPAMREEQQQLPKQKQNTQRGGSQAGGSLEDIERSLGLR